MRLLNMTPDQAAQIARLHELGIERYDESLPLYKYMSLETAIRVLETSTIKFSTPLELNDNDLEMGLLYPNISEELKKESVISMITAKLDSAPDEIRQRLNRPEIIKGFAERLDTSLFQDITLKGYEEQRKAVGIFCATTSPYNKKMWKQYADKGKGICLRFDFPSRFSNLYITFKVCYSQQFEQMNLLDSSGAQDDVSIHRWIYTKRKHYEHEQEVRICSNDLIGIVSVPKDIIGGIYFGKRVSEDAKKKIQSILSINNYPFVDGETVDYAHCKL